MFNKILNHPLFKSYLRLPLWSKIAIPVGAFLVVGWVLQPLLKLALIIGAVGVGAYFLMSRSEK
ncbi:MAG: hypothetical protein NWR72_01695 [Bacteroidia bacterium]|nr:hypothetical protein [Bacteroidia bacterium]